MRLSLGLLSFFLVSLNCGIAGAQDCKPPVLLNTIQMEPMAGGNAMLVPFTINDSPRKLLLGTGGASTQLSQSAVLSLNLAPQGGGLHPLTNQWATRWGQFVTAHDVTLGRLHETDMRFEVNPNPLWGFKGRPYDGLVSDDLLLRYDFDVDFGNNTINLFSQDHCPGKIPDWKADKVAAVPVDIKKRVYLFVSVILDGKKVTAVIDTGIADTTMRTIRARRYFDLEKESSDPSVDIPGFPPMVGQIHTFSSLSFGDVTVKNARVTITRYKSSEDELFHGVPQNEPDLILGMNVLKYLHLYVAPKEEKLYVSAASPVPKVEENDKAAPKP